MYVCMYVCEGMLLDGGVGSPHLFAEILYLCIYVCMYVRVYACMYYVIAYCATRE